MKFYFHFQWGIFLFPDYAMRLADTSRKKCKYFCCGGEKGVFDFWPYGAITILSVLVSLLRIEGHPLDLFCNVPHVKANHGAKNHDIKNVVMGHLNPSRVVEGNQG